MITNMRTEGEDIYVAEFVANITPQMFIFCSA